MIFNKELLADLLRQAKGDRSINRFGLETNVDPGYISRLLRCQVSTPPSAMVLAKIAGKASGDVTVEDLMSAAGYIPPGDGAGLRPGRAPAGQGAAGHTPHDGGKPEFAGLPQEAADSDPMVDELLSFCKEMIERPLLLDAFKQIRKLGDEKLRRAARMIRMIEEMGE
jgi:hypothetical protein